MKKEKLFKFWTAKRTNAVKGEKEFSIKATTGAKLNAAIFIQNQSTFLHKLFTKTPVQKHL